MFCYIFFTSLALLISSDLVKSSSVESSEDSRKPLKIDLKTLKNAAEVVRVLKALNEDGEEPDLQENYGNYEDKGLQGIDLDYLGFSGDRHENIRELLELIQKNRVAKEDHDQMRSELTPRVYYISNPEALEVYKEKVKRDKENYHSATQDLNDSNEKSANIRNLWELLKTMRREGDANKKVYPKMMIHPRLLHLNLENHVPVFGPSIHKDIKDDKEISAKKGEEKRQGKREDIKESNLDFLPIFTDAKKEKLTSGLNNLDTTKISSYSFEVTEKENLNEALRTAGFKYHILDDNIDDESDDKRDSSDKSEDNDKRVTKIDFKAKQGSSIEANKEFDDKSLESYNPKKKKDKSKFEDNDNFMKKSIETYKSPKKKERLDNNDSLDYKKKKQNRWDKPAAKTNRWEKSKEKINKYDNDKKEKIEEKFNFKPKPRKEARNYEMNRPKIKQEISRPVRNKMTNLREDNGAKRPFKLFGRTPVPIVGKRGIYEDD